MGWFTGKCLNSFDYDTVSVKKKKGYTMSMHSFS